MMIEVTISIECVFDYYVWVSTFYSWMEHQAKFFVLPILLCVS